MLLLMIRVRMLSFGVLKDALGAEPVELELPGGASVGELLAEMTHRYPTAPLQGIAVSVNAEYAGMSQVLRDGDEVGLLPPVSGGATGSGTAAKAPHPAVVAYLTREPITAESIVSAAKRGEDGAVVIFDGIVRDNSRGRKTLHLDYEAYEEMAAKQLVELAQQARDKYGVRNVTIAHRLGRLLVGETSVLIVVASAHRGQAFDACRWIIDTLKKTVPIWKRETFVDGAVWAAGEPFPSGIGVESSNVP